MTSPETDQNLPPSRYVDIVAAYKIVFALMYEDIEGPVELPTSAYKLFTVVHAFMDLYQCYASRTMCARLEALILGNRSGGVNIVHCRGLGFLAIGKALRSPDIWIEAVKSAALGHWFHFGTWDYDAPKFEEGNSEWKFFYGYDSETIPIVRAFSHAISQH